MIRKLAGKDYTTVGLPNGLAREIDSLVKKKKHGYRNRGEFVADAVRIHLRAIDTYLRSKSQDVIKEKRQGTKE